MTIEKTLATLEMVKSLGYSLHLFYDEDIESDNKWFFEINGIVYDGEDLMELLLRVADDKICQEMVKENKCYIKEKTRESELKKGDISENQKKEVIRLSKNAKIRNYKKN